MGALPVTTPSPDELDHAATVLARAFATDPMLVTNLPDPVRRTAGLPLLFRAMARQVAGHGLLDLSPDGSAAALWARPGVADVGPLQILRFGYLRFGLACGLRDALRLSSAQDAIGRHHGELLPEDHGYLFALGVDPAHQGRGVGSRMLDIGCRRLDEHGLPGYLETNLPQNVRLYERFGFEVRRHLPADGCKRFDTWLMVRPAAR